MNTTESNELIARFMGLETQLNTGPGYTFPFPLTKGDYDTLFQIDCGHGDEMLYNSSWDWLMPVIYKIFEANEDIKTFSGQGVFEMGFGVSVEEAYSEVVEYIEWYNQNNTNG